MVSKNWLQYSRCCSLSLSRLRGRGGSSLAGDCRWRSLQDSGPIDIESLQTQPRLNEPEAG